MTLNVTLNQKVSQKINWFKLGWIHKFDSVHTCVIIDTTFFWNANNDFMMGDNFRLFNYSFRTNVRITLPPPPPPPS